MPGKVSSFSMLNLRDGECLLNIKQLKLTSKNELPLFYVSNKTYVVVLFNYFEELFLFVGIFYVEYSCLKKTDEF